MPLCGVRVATAAWSTSSTRACFCGTLDSPPAHGARVFTSGGGGSIEPPKTGGGVREKGSNDRH